MDIATGILVIVAVILLIYAWRRGDGSHLRGINQGWLTLRSTAALLLAAFAISGYMTVLSPQNLVQAWIGPHSGFGGLVLAEGVGLLLPGGPYVIFPLVAVLYTAGAGLAPVITMVASWALLALVTVSFELPFMGWRFTMVRWGMGLILPLLAGIAAQLVFGG